MWIAGEGLEPSTSGLWTRRASRLLYPAVSPGLPGIYANKRWYRSRQPNAFGFMVHYNIFKTEKQEKTEKL